MMKRGKGLHDDRVITKGNTLELIFGHQSSDKWEVYNDLVKMKANLDSSSHALPELEYNMLPQLEVGARMNDASWMSSGPFPFICTTHCIAQHLIVVAIRYYKG